MLYFVIAFLVIVVDQLTKWFVTKEMYLGQSIVLIENYLYLTSHRNQGAAFGILQGQRIFFILITIIVIIGLVYYLLRIKQKKPLVACSLSLILGGAVGNFIDRLMTGAVVDFIDVKINLGTFYYDYPIFNIADSALVIGVALLIIDIILESRQEMKAGRLD